jgi:hypothetical protein
VLNFPADTTGTVIANDNTTGIQMSFGIAMGSSYTSGTLATTWAADSSANAFVGQVNNADSTSNNWEITGVQLEVGEYTSSTLPPFQHESYGDNLKRCMRYYFTDALYSSGGNTGLVEAYIGTSDANYKHIFKQFPVAMRAAPTISNIDFRQDVAASSTALTSIDSAFATTLTADLYGRNNDHAAPGYYHGADYSAEL